MSLTKQQVVNVIRSSPFGKWTEELAAKLRPSIKILAQKNPDCPLGCSKLWGSPDLPLNWEWPEQNGKPLNFILQINLEEAHSFDIENQLPSKGWLYFFCIYDGESDPENGRVLYYDGEFSSLGLRKSPHPSQEACELRYELYYMLPSDNNVWLDEEVVNQIECDLDLNDFAPPYNKDVTHDIFGLRDILLFSIGQSKPNYDGPYSHLLGYFESAQDNELQDDEQLLLQLQPEPSQYEETWGDMGSLFYYIEKDDLKHKKFEGSSVSMQSH